MILKILRIPLSIDALIVAEDGNYLSDFIEDKPISDRGSH
jgi:hypothetical protein